MNVQVYSVPGETEWRRRAFLKWTKIDLPSKLSITCGSNFTYYKSVHHPIPTLFVGILNTMTIFTINLKALLSIVQVYSLLGQTEEERKALFGKCKNGRRILRFPQTVLGCHKRLKSLSFCEIWK